VRYLRRRDEVVVPTADGAFLVNGRSRESLEELFQRANRMRVRDQLPQFVSLPDAPLASNGSRKAPSRGLLGMGGSVSRSGRSVTPCLRN